MRPSCGKGSQVYSSPKKALEDFTRVCREQGLDLDYGREEK